MSPQETERFMGEQYETYKTHAQLHLELKTGTRKQDS